MTTKITGGKATENCLGNNSLYQVEFPFTTISKSSDPPLLVKKYLRSDLKESDSEISSRTDRIFKLSKEFSCIPETEYFFEKDFITCHQHLVQKQTWPQKDQIDTFCSFIQLAKELDQISSQIVHGDLTKKNILYDGRAFKIVDWEPCLKQRRRGRLTLMYTEPYISFEDRHNNRISQLTDKLTFVFSAFRGLHGFLPFKDARYLTQMRIKGKRALLPITEAILGKMNFIELVHYAFEEKEEIRKHLQQ